MDAIKITKSFENHLSTKDLVGLKTFLNDEKFLDILSQECLDVVPHVCNVFNERNEVDDAELITVCKKYIAEFARRSSPKEMLIALLEQSEKFNEDLLFLSILDALQVVLQRLPSKKVNLCRWVFETLYLNIKASKIPEAGDDEGQSKKDDDKSFKMHDILDSFVSFLEPFVESVELSPSSKSNFVDVESQGQLRNLLAVTLLRLIEFPIIFIDQSADEKFQHRYVRNIMDYLSRMTGDMFEYYNHRKLSESIESVKIGNFVEEHLTDVTSAGFAYLLIGLEIEKQKLPCVYSRAFVVRKNITQCLVLFRHFDNAIVLKGIVLAEKTFHHVDDRELDFDLSEFAELAMCVVNVMVNCPQTSVRQPAVKFLRDYLCKFDDKRRYDLVLMLLTSCKHSGVKGYLIQIYKTFLDASVVGKESCTFYETECLNRMVKAMIELPFGMEMDLLENSDQIIAAINFLRYLILQDINGNVGFYFHAASKVLCKFLNDLKTGVDISEAHYKTELQHSASEDDDAMMPISDDGHLSIIHRALNTFDVMRCLIARYEELFDICKSKHSQ